MKQLNNYQLAVLNRGAEEESKGFFICGYPKQETTSLIRKYKQFINNKWNCEEYELLYLALLDLYDFWAAYFALGADVALLLHEERTIDEY